MVSRVLSLRDNVKKGTSSEDVLAILVHSISEVHGTLDVKKA